METFLEAIFAAAIVALFGLVAYALYEGYEHTKFLEAHGCQLLVKAPTGRDVRVGKTSRTEYVWMYECADGDRTEVHD